MTDCSVKNAHAAPADDVLMQLATDRQGLTAEEAAERKAKFGENALAGAPRKSVLAIFLSQFRDFMIWVLIAAGGISAVLGEWVDACIILIVVALNAVLGTMQESKAESALAALKKMAAPFARALRGGTIASIPAADLVPGDVVALEAGDSVPADLRLFECASLKVEESSLTGESLPVEKNINVQLAEDDALADRVNMAYLGTNVTYGRALGVVVGTGMNTEMGKIAGKIAEEKDETTPLQRKLNQISNTLSIGVLAIAALIFVVGMLGGQGAFEMFFTAVSLSVAAIPEGMVAVVTIVLAMGMSRMAARGAIIRHLPAVETLGSTQIICSDKTGTLTQNRMTVTKLHAQDQALLCEAMGHCNDSRLSAEGTPIGDPTETAMIDFVVKNATWTRERVEKRQRAGEIPFDSERKRSTVAVALPGGTLVRVYVKGAPDGMFARLTAGTPVAELEAKNDEMASSALRVLAFAYKDIEQKDFNASDVDGMESGLTFIGLVGMIDPPRPEAMDAMATCRKAGVLPVMITGDHKVTAVAIARQLTMLDDGREAITGAELAEMDDATFEKRIPHIGVYARVAPEHKSRIVRMWQKLGKIVAMTGDGVNDAPALKAADIGVGMGITGTDVSKGASDMVLTDDNFATIVTAVGEGRRIFDNIHKTVRFLLSSNAGEVIAILLATIAGWRLLAPVHILWINLVTDTFPALALGVEPAEKDIMSRPPRDSARPFFTGAEWFHVAFIGLCEGLLTLSAFLIGKFAMGSDTVGTTMAFLTLAFAQLFAALGFHSERTSILRIVPKDHRMLWLALAGSAVLQLVVTLIPLLRGVFGLAALSLGQYGIVFALCLLMLGFVELQKWITRKRGK